MDFLSVPANDDTPSDDGFARLGAAIQATDDDKRRRYGELREYLAQATGLDASVRRIAMAAVDDTIADIGTRAGADAEGRLRQLRIIDGSCQIPMGYRGHPTYLADIARGVSEYPPGKAAGLLVRVCRAALDILR